MVDTHAHLNINKYNGTIEDVVDRAKAKGVNQIIVIGMDYETSVDAINIAKRFNNIYATVGVHPSYVDNSNHYKLDGLYSENKVVAVGEIGLDFYWRKDNKELQEKVFIEQLEKAIELDLPVIIHTRNSFDETFKIVEKYKGKLRGVFHCFSGNLEDAMKVIDLGFYIGIDGPITFPKSTVLHEIAEKISLDKILIETDSPYLTPVPYRGKTNEPKNVYYVAMKIAEIKKINLKEVVETTTNNAKTLFGLEANK